MKYIRRIFWLASSLFIIFTFFGSSVVAASANLSRSYQSKSTLVAGSLVSIDPNNSGYVELTNTSNSSGLIGIVVSNTDSLLSINSQAGLPQVAVSGTANTLVSTLNGSISIGDQVGVSPINGVGMEAVSGSKVIGVALAKFSTNTAGVSTRQVKDARGKTNIIAVGYIPVQIVIGTLASAQTSNQPFNQFKNTIDTIVGHNVSTFSLVVSFIIAFLALVSIIVLIYASIRGSILGVARNPLAKWSIFQALAQIMAMASLIVILSLIAIYLLLR
jgi:hypothetical protein